MMISFEHIINFLQSPHFLFWVEVISASVKLYVLSYLIIRGFRSPNIPMPLVCLVGILGSGLIVDFSWIVKLLRINYFEGVDYRFVVFLIRLAWASNLIQYQSLGLFVESLGEKNYKVRWHQKLFFILNSGCIGYFIYLAFFQFNSITFKQRPPLEFKLMSINSLYVILLLVLPSLFITIYRLRLPDFPKILKRQLTVLIKYFIGTFVISEFIQGLVFTPMSTGAIYLTSSISTPVLTFAMYYCMRTIIDLRFLNFQNHVQSKHVFNFIDDFKNLLEQFSHIASKKELTHITQMFFKDAFGIIPNRSLLYFRKLDATSSEYEDLREPSFVESAVESFVSRHSNEVCTIAEALHRYKILINDEISFSNFYEEDETHQELLHFLDQINADVFLPIYEKRTLIAYIVVERDARLNDFYSNVERDEMLVFASYLGNIINLLQNRNLNTMIQKEKEMREELYNKHQEINQYKESLRSFLRDTKQRKIGILFYKNRRFILGNKEAKDLLDININAHEGHPLTKALKSVARQVEEYKSSHVSFAKDSQGNRLVIAGLPNLEQNNVIITIYYPEVSDIIKKQIDYLHNPSEWDYLLYLETTKSGQLINQLIPGSGMQLLNFKIELLKLALSKKALLLEMAEDDLRPTVEIMHHISLREQLHVLKLTAQTKTSEIAMKLFGINPIFGIQQQQPILEKLHNVGTLFIENVHLLDLETQGYLAEYIKYGYYHIYKSDQRVSSNVRIICSTNQNLQTLIQEGRFSRALFNELKQTTLTMPSLYSLPDEELSKLAEGFTEQAIASPAFKNLLELTDKDKHKLVDARPVSLQEFKNKIQNVLVQKSKKSQIYQETQFDPAYNISDPELIQAARLGKKALRDPKIMAILWNKFRNQNKISAFLGVNRSSVNRRCKEYNLC